MKVIQILYSFLLVEKKFTLESTPSAPTKEKRFAYALYLDMLVLLIRISREIEGRRTHPLENTRFISRLLIDEQIRMLLEKYRSEPFPFEGVMESLSEKVAESAIYKRFLKDAGDETSGTEDNVWSDIFNLIIINDPDVNAAISQRLNYTLKGVERMREMMGVTFRSFLGSQENVNEVLKALGSSLDMARELYIRLLCLPVELTDMQARILDENRYKFLKSEEDINPNLRFVENRVVAELSRSAELSKAVNDYKLSWTAEEPIMMRSLLKAVTESDYYRDYMAAPVCDVHDDAELWRNLFKRVILTNEFFLETLEEKSVFWNDDIDILSTFVMKSFRRIEDGDTTSIVLEKFKDEEDARFGDELIRHIFRNKETYRRYVEEAVEGSSWDSERLAFMDIVILETAIAELLNFPKIPLQVTLNEYIELAKSYSTSKSGSFVHGLLAKIVKRLQEEGKLLKR